MGPRLVSAGAPWHAETPMRWSRPLAPGLVAAVGLVAALLGAAAAGRPVWAANPTAADPGQAAPKASASGEVTIDSLLARFRGIVGLSAHFREEKHIALLAQPLVSEGTVHYAPPGRIARHTLTPSPSSVVLDGTTLRFGDATSEHSIDTGASPVVRAFVDSFLAILAGDRASLERSFVVDFHNPAGQKWEIALVPRDPTLARIIREIRFAGDDVVISQMRIREASGDEGVTTFTDVDAAHRYTQAEADRVFRLAR